MEAKKTPIKYGGVNLDLYIPKYLARNSNASVLGTANAYAL